jgi:hypothetical protein
MCYRKISLLKIKDTFFTMHLIVQGQLGLKISDQKQKNVTRNGGRKSVTYMSCIIRMIPIYDVHAFAFLVP